MHQIVEGITINNVILKLGLNEYSRIENIAKNVKHVKYIHTSKFDQ